MQTSPKHPTQIGARLRAARKAFELGQGDFAERAGVKANAYNQWEHGKRRPEIDGAIKLAETYGLTLDWIFLGSPRGLDPALVGRMNQPRT